MMRFCSRSLLAAALLVALAAPAAATKYAGEFMKIPVGARAVGMGGAFSAVSDDATSPYWNPAGMVFLPYREAFLQHAEQFGSLVNHNFGGYVMPLRSQGHDRAALGLSATWVGVNDIPITPLRHSLRAGLDFIDDNHNGVWDPGERLLISPEDFYMAASNDIAVGVSYARQRGQHWCLGGSLKFVRQSIPDSLPGQHVTSFGAGIDAGLLYMASDAVTLSGVIHDATTTYLSWSDGVREFVAPTITTGAAFNFLPAQRHALTWAVDLAWNFEDRSYDSELKMGGVTADLHTGLEYWYRNTLALRSGISGKDLNFGLGVRYRHFGADYAASLNHFLSASDPQFPDDKSLSATHLVSASLSW